jgi:hypothetical protein
MKTTISFLRSKTFAQCKAPAGIIYILIALFSFILLPGCQKNLNDVKAPASSANESGLQLKKYGAGVATDWYKLQLRFLLEKNSVLANGSSLATSASAYMSRYDM